MQISLKELRKVIREQLSVLNEDQYRDIIAKTIQIKHYPPNTTRTEFGTKNTRDYFEATDYKGDVVSSGESMQDILMSLRRSSKYLYFKRYNKETGYTEFVHIPTGKVAAESGKSGKIFTAA